jgi:O-antigen/teichoic acid export membrane protein
MAEPLVHAWVGPEFSASGLVLRLLSLTVIVRVGSATASTLLKGAGEHRLVAFTNIASAVANLALSIAIVKPLGLPGVAIGTLAPVCLASTLVLFPAGCRRVQLSVGRAIREAVWPAVWPAGVMTAFVLATRDLVPLNLVAVGIELVLAAGVYALVFVFLGISAGQRRMYLSHALELLARRAPAEPAPAALPEGA